MSTDKFWDYFYEIYESIPRQGPGERASTERALRLLPPLTPDDRILDIGCGSGAQTMDLARATEARIVAVDNHAEFISQLEQRAAAEGLGERITAQVADMNELPFPDGSFDVIWSEGAIFIIGFAKGLETWRRLLRPGGYIVVSEFCWMCEDPPTEMRELFLDGNPDVGDVQAKRSTIAESGYRLVDEFVLPPTGWWESYCEPLSECLKHFRSRYAGNSEALEVASRSEHEIELFRRHAGTFGYVFFVMQLRESN